MRCRDVEALWDELRGECQASLKETVHTPSPRLPVLPRNVRAVRRRRVLPLCLPRARALVRSRKESHQHIAAIKGKLDPPIVLSAVKTPIGKLYIGLKCEPDRVHKPRTGEAPEEVLARVERRLHRRCVAGESPAWLLRALESFFDTWTVDDALVDISDLTPFEQEVLRAAASIPPGEVRSYAWVATQVGRPRAARAVGRVMARNPLPLLFPCHRVVDSSGELHDYYYGVEMKARILEMEGYRG